MDTQKDAVAEAERLVEYRLQDLDDLRAVMKARRHPATSSYSHYRQLRESVALVVRELERHSAVCGLL